MRRGDLDMVPVNHPSLQVLLANDFGHVVRQDFMHYIRTDQFGRELDVMSHWYMSFPIDLTTDKSLQTYCGSVVVSFMSQLGLFQSLLCLTYSIAN